MFICAVNCVCSYVYLRCELRVFVCSFACVRGCSQFSFAGNRLAVPWVDVYDAKHQRRLEKLILTFTHDDVDVLQVRASTTCALWLEIVICVGLEFTKARTFTVLLQTPKQK